MKHALEHKNHVDTIIQFSYSDKSPKGTKIFKISNQSTVT